MGKHNNMLLYMVVGSFIIFYMWNNHLLPFQPQSTGGIVGMPNSTSAHDNNTNASYTSFKDSSGSNYHEAKEEKSGSGKATSIIIWVLFVGFLIYWCFKNAGRLWKWYVGLFRKKDEDKPKKKVK